MKFSHTQKKQHLRHVALPDTEALSSQRLVKLAELGKVPSAEKPLSAPTDVQELLLWHLRDDFGGGCWARKAATN